MNIILLLVVIGLLIWVIYRQQGLADNQMGMVKEFREGMKGVDKLKVRIDDFNGRDGV